MTVLLILRAVLALVCLSHLILGGIAFISIPQMITSMAAAFYGASVTLTPQLQHTVRILGAFMIAIGVLAAFALWDPWRNRAIIYGVAVLEILRVLQRLIFAAQIHDVFGVSYGRLLGQSAFFLALALALLLLRPEPERSSGCRARR